MTYDIFILELIEIIILKLIRPKFMAKYGFAILSHMKRNGIIIEKIYYKANSTIFLNQEITNDSLNLVAKILVMHPIMKFDSI